MDSDDEPFLYTGQSSRNVPRDVTHVKVDPTVKVIGKDAFGCCYQLRNVELCEGLEQIDAWSFGFCTSLTSISIPSTVKVIGDEAFDCCNQLRNVKLCEGLEILDDHAFGNCIELERINIPSTVKRIGSSFEGCYQLRSVELCEGLERIDSDAFYGCKSLQRISIPSTVKYICMDAFKDCDSLVAIEFCDEIEKFVNELSLPWWNNGVSEAAWITYSFLAQRNIPARLDKLTATVWKKNIYNMLQLIPEILKDDENEYNEDEEGDDEEEDYEQEEEENGVTYYFAYIESQLSNYEHLQEVAPFLELALWKAKITEQANGNIIQDDTKILCRVNSFSMFAIIFPNVLSFLFEE